MLIYLNPLYSTEGSHRSHTAAISLLTESSVLGSPDDESPGGSIAPITEAGVTRFSLAFSTFFLLGVGIRSGVQDEAPWSQA